MIINIVSPPPPNGTVSHSWFRHGPTALGPGATMQDPQAPS